MLYNEIYLRYENTRYPICIAEYYHLLSNQLCDVDANTFWNHIILPK